MRVFKTRDFKEWADDEGLTDSALLRAVAEIESGLIGDNLGGSLYKKRVAIGARGKSGGVRTFVACKTEYRAFFVYGFAKNEQSNINKKELLALKEYGKELLGYSDSVLNKALAASVLYEAREYEEVDPGNRPRRGT